MDRITKSEAEFDESLKNVLKDLTDPGTSTSLVSVLEDLGPLLTSKDLYTRKTGVAFLSGLITGLPSRNNLLEAPERKLLLEFFCDRMKDHHSMYPSIIAAIRRLLTENDKLEAELVVATLRCFFNEIQTQSQVVKDRSVVFDLMAKLLRDRLKVLVDLMGAEFILGFTQAVDGEKDPRNLTVIFSCWPTIIANFDFEPFTEDMFEVLACYFPIDFEGGGEVTKMELIEGLRACLAATADFAPFAIPLLLEKIESDLVSAKLDALETFSRCCNSVYDAKVLRMDLENIWRTLRIEIMGIRMTTDLAEIEKAALGTLTSVTKSLETDEGVLRKWVEDIIWVDIQRHLKDPELKLMATSVSVVRAVASASSVSRVLILERAIPSLMDTFTKTQEHKSTVLVLTGSVLNEVTPNDPISSEDFESAVLTSLNSSDPIIVKSALKSLASGGINLFKSEKNLEIIISLLLHLLKEQDLEIDLKLIKSLVKNHLGLIKENLVKFQEIRNESVLPILQEFCSSNQELCLSIFPELLKSAAADEEAKLRCLSEVWKNQISLHPRFLKEFSLLEKLYSFETEAEVKYDFISDITETLRLPKDREFITEFTRSVKKNTKIMEAQWRSVRPEVIEADDGKILDSMFSPETENWILENPPEKITPVLRLRFNLLNKVKDTEDLIWRLFEDFDRNPVWSESRLLSLVWTIRASLLKGTKDLAKWTDLLLRVFRAEDEKENSNISEVFKIIIADPDSDIPKHKFLQISSIFRQKFFHFTSAGLISGFSDGNHKSRFLSALISQLDGIPNHVLSSETPKLKSIMIQALRSSDEELISATLISMRRTLITGIDIETFLPLWISIAVNDKWMKNRIEALQCIEEAAKTSSTKTTAELIRLQPEVVRKIIPALDDRKRLVRRAAVQAKNAWDLLN